MRDYDGYAAVGGVLQAVGQRVQQERRSLLCRGAAAIDLGC